MRRPAGDHPGAADRVPPQTAHGSAGASRGVTATVRSAGTPFHSRRRAARREGMAPRRRTARPGREARRRWLSVGRRRPPSESGSSGGLSTPPGRDSRLPRRGRPLRARPCGQAFGGPGASTTADPVATEGPTGPLSGLGRHAVIFRMRVGPPPGRKAGPPVERRVSRVDADLRGRADRPGLGAEAQTDVLTVAHDGNATQHQGSQSEDGHDGPPAIARERSGGPRRARRQTRGGKGFSVSSPRSLVPPRRTTLRIYRYAILRRPCQGFFKKFRRRRASFSLLGRRR